MSTPTEYQILRERHDRLREGIAALAGDWEEAEDAADDYGPRIAFDGRDCAEHLRALLDQEDGK